MTVVLFDVTAHGFGHLAQSAPVIHEVRVRIDQVTVIVRSGLPEQRLRARIAAPFDYCPASDSFGLVMLGPFHVDAQATIERYRLLHAAYDKHVGELASYLDNRGVDLVVSNAGYAVLAAAERAGIPALGFGSVNWFDVLRHYFPDEPVIRRILPAIIEAYGAAAGFVRLEPGLPMGGIATATCHRPIVASGRSRAVELRSRFALAAQDPIITFGFDAAADKPARALIADMASMADSALLLVPVGWGCQRPSVSFEDVGISFLDAVSSASLVVAKPGYGMVTEAAAAGVPLALVGRRDWPETEAFLRWVEGRIPNLHIDVALESLRLRDLQKLLAPRAAPVTGAAEAAFGGGEAIIADMIAQILAQQA